MPQEKDVTLQVRMPREMRDTFVAACKELDTTAAQELRKCIRAFLDRHEEKIPQTRG